MLLITTERYNLMILSYDSENKRIETRAFGNVEERIGRPTECGQRAIVDPLSRVIGLHHYEGLFIVIPFDQSSPLKEAFNIR